MEALAILGVLLLAFWVQRGAFYVAAGVARALRRVLPVLVAVGLFGAVQGVRAQSWSVVTIAGEDWYVLVDEDITLAAGEDFADVIPAELVGRYVVRCFHSPTDGDTRIGWDNTTPVSPKIACYQSAALAAGDASQPYLDSAYPSAWVSPNVPGYGLDNYHGSVGSVVRVQVLGLVVEVTPTPTPTGTPPPPYSGGCVPALTLTPAVTASPWWQTPAPTATGTPPPLPTYAPLCVGYGPETFFSGPGIWALGADAYWSPTVGRGGSGGLGAVSLLIHPEYSNAWGLPVPVSAGSYLAGYWWFATGSSAVLVANDPSQLDAFPGGSGLVNSYTPGVWQRFVIPVPVDLAGVQLWVVANSVVALDDVRVICPGGYAGEFGCIGSATATPGPTATFPAIPTIPVPWEYDDGGIVDYNIVIHDDEDYCLGYDSFGFEIPSEFSVGITPFVWTVQVPFSGAHVFQGLKLCALRYEIVSLGFGGFDVSGLIQLALAGVPLIVTVLSAVRTARR